MSIIPKEKTGSLMAKPVLLFCPESSQGGGPRQCLLLPYPQVSHKFGVFYFCYITIRIYNEHEIV